MALESTAQLRKNLRRIAGRERNLALFTGVARTVISLLIFITVFFLLDWLLSLPRVARLILLAAGITGLLWVVRTYLLVPIKALMDEDIVALKVETRFPELQDRLISVVQLTRSEKELEDAGMSLDLLRRLESDTAELTATLNFSEIIDWDFVRKISLIAAGLVVVAVLATSQFSEYVMTAISRMALTNRKYPTLTNIELVDPVTKILQGDDWPLKVEIAGRIPYQVILYRKSESDRGWEEIEMRPEMGSTYSIMIEKIYESFRYQVEAGDARTDKIDVAVLEPIKLKSLTVDVTPPGYTGLKPVKGALLSAIEVAEGSLVKLTVHTTKKVISGQLLPMSGGSVPLKPISSGDGLSVEFTASVSMNFTVSAVDTDGLKNPEPLMIYRLEVRPDRSPKVAVTAPKGEKTSVPIGKWDVMYRIKDDYGVTASWLSWRVDPVPEGGGGVLMDADPIREGRDVIPIPTSGEGRIKLSMIPKHMKVGEVLTAWIEAADARSSLALGAIWSSSQKGKGTGLTGEYFKGTDFSQSILKRADKKIDFKWENKAPAEGVPADNFCVRWTGIIEPVHEKGRQTYTFYTITDDGVRLWVDEQRIVDKWIRQGPTEHSGTVDLKANRRYEIKMEYYDGGSGATAQLLWQSDGVTKEVIPTQRLYPALEKDASQLMAKAAGRSDIAQSASIQFTIIDENAKWNELDGRLKTAEETIVKMRDKQRDVKKTVDRLREDVK